MGNLIYVKGLKFTLKPQGNDVICVAMIYDEYKRTSRLVQGRKLKFYLKAKKVPPGGKRNLGTVGDIYPNNTIAVANTTPNTWYLPWVNYGVYNSEPEGIHAQVKIYYKYKKFFNSYNISSMRPT